VRKVDSIAIDQKYGEILFEVPSILGKSYKFFKDKFVVSKLLSKQLEEIPYSDLKDCDVQIRSSVGGEGGGGYWTEITLTLKSNPECQMRFRGNPMNARLDSDLAFWLNAKVAENESKAADQKLII